MTMNEVLYCLIAFILGYLVNRMMGNGFSVGAQSKSTVGCDDGYKLQGFGGTAENGDYCNRTYGMCIPKKYTAIAFSNTAAPTCSDYDNSNQCVGDNSPLDNPPPAPCKNCPATGKWEPVKFDVPAGEKPSSKQYVTADGGSNTWKARDTQDFNQGDKDEDVYPTDVCHTYDMKDPKSGMTEYSYCFGGERNLCGWVPDFRPVDPEKCDSFIKEIPCEPGPNCGKCVSPDLGKLRTKGCTYEEIGNYCDPCGQAIKKTGCHPVSGGTDECHSCLYEHRNDIQEACGTGWEDRMKQFCKTPISATCKKALNTLCNHLSVDQCEKCVEKNTQVLLHDGCDETDVVNFCKVAADGRRRSTQQFAPARPQPMGVHTSGE